MDNNCHIPDLVQTFSYVIQPHLIWVCPISGACYSLFVVEGCLSYLFFVNCFWSEIMFNLFYVSHFDVSQPFIDDYTV